MRITDNEDKKRKSQKVVSRLEKDLADASKELQTLATPSKMMVAVFVMVVMFSVQKRYRYTCMHTHARESKGWAGRRTCSGRPA